MAERSTDRDIERRELAERWRQLGEKLRRRSPRVFEKTIEMLATSATPDDDEATEDIDEVYLIH